MKILHIATIDIGGAFKGAWRLSESLKRCGMDSQVMVRTKRGNEPEVRSVFSDPIAPVISKAKNGINRLFARGEIFRDLLGTDISHIEQVRQADVLVLHWVNSFLSTREVMKIVGLKKPVIWVLHDMWLFTGGCHYDGYCGRYMEECGNCPLIQGDSRADISRKNFDDKKRMMKSADIIITGPSEWIVDCARKSSILREKEIYHIPNAVDTDLYRVKENKKALRKKYQISGNRKVVLFGAADNGTENEKKGFRYLREAFSSLEINDYELVIFGNSGRSSELPPGLEVLQTGYISDEEKLIELYHLADVIVAPSVQEVFGYTVCEAMACGTPAVSFPVGGLKEQISHLENGYLAVYQDPEDLARGIRYCADHTEWLGENAREAALRYSFENIGGMFGGLCRKLVCQTQKRDNISGDRI